MISQTNPDMLEVNAARLITLLRQLALQVWSRRLESGCHNVKDSAFESQKIRYKLDPGAANQVRRQWL